MSNGIGPYFCKNTLSGIFGAQATSLGLLLQLIRLYALITWHSDRLMCTVAKYDVASLSSYLTLTPLFVDMDFLVLLDARIASAKLLVLFICRRTRVSSCSISQNCTFRGLPGSYFALTPLACVLEQNICNTTSLLCAILL